MSSWNQTTTAGQSEGAIVPLGVRDHPFGELEIEVFPLGAGELADAGAGRQKDLGRQGILLADEGEGRKDHPQLVLGQLQTQARLPPTADRRNGDASAWVGDDGMAGDAVFKNLAGGGEYKFSNGDRSFPDSLDHPDNVSCRDVAGGDRPQSRQKILFDVPPPVLDRAPGHAGKGDCHVAGREFPKGPGCRPLGVVGLLVTGDVLALLDLGAGCRGEFARLGEADVGVAPEGQLSGPSAEAVAEHPGSRSLGRQGEGQSATIRSGKGRAASDPVPDLNVG